MAKQRTYPNGLALFRAHPAGAGLIVVITTVLGWLGCDSLSHVADRTADLMNQVPPSSTATAPATQSPWGMQSQYPAAQPPTGSYPYRQQQPNPYANASYNAGTAAGSTAAPTEPLISIGSFNIQVFGTSKINDPTLMTYLVDIARKFDILAIQELRSTDDTIIPRFAQMINQSGAQYGYVVGPREGHTSSKEQYVFIYNEQKIERVDQGMVLRHPQRLLHRDPLAVTFRCRTPNPQNGFSFTLINIHTDPDVVASELDALADIWQMARQAFRYEDDLILLGDLNAAPNEFRRLGQVPNLYAAIPPQMTTNTARTKCYDNLVFDRLATSEFQSKSGAFDLAQYYNLTIDQAKLISDHQPVWGLFSAYERPAVGVAAQPLGLR
jgi:endonuclease/exonuclease/phosphatase family metal-dependent hydrolase